MVHEAVLFTNEERYPIDRSIIDQVALPVGDNYADDLFTEYFADYAGMAKKYKPKRIYEIGVRYGYTAICMILGCRANRGAPKAEYVGVDDESYHACVERANDNFKTVVPFATAYCHRWNSFHGVPKDVGTFDMIHIDGNHDYHGVMNDLRHTWPILNPGGLILLDDAAEFDAEGRPGPIYRAIQDFLSELNAGLPRVEYQLQPNQRTHVYIKRCE